MPILEGHIIIYVDQHNQLYDLKEKMSFNDYVYNIIDHRNFFFFSIF